MTPSRHFHDVTELDALLEIAAARGYLLHTGRHGSEILAGVFHHNDCVDVFVFADGVHAYAYRLPTDTDTDLFTPTVVYWWYRANPVWTLRALLTLSAPDQPDAPHTLIPAPSGIWVTETSACERRSRSSLTPGSAFDPAAPSRR